MKTPNDLRCELALRRLHSSINRAAGQHLRAIQDGFAQCRRERFASIPFAIKVEQASNGKSVLMTLGPIHPMCFGDRFLNVRLSSEEADSLAMELTCPF